MKNQVKWRLLDTGARSAAENIALDETILETHAKGLVPNTLRFLQFNPHAALVGYHQSIENELRIEYCKTHGIAIGRRITGGGAIYFDTSQLGWEVFASKRDLGVSVVNERLFGKMCAGIIAGLRKLGIEAQFRPKNDIEIKGRKVTGTGGTEVGDSFMFQGTLLIDFDVNTMLRALRIPTKKLEDKEIESVKDRVTWLSKEMARLPSLEVLKDHITAGFAETFGVSFEQAPLADEERTLFEDKLKKMRSRAWIYQNRGAVTSALFASHKTRGGLIKVSLVYAERSKTIEQIIITGDFFAFPHRAVYDLEAALKGIIAREKKIEKAVEDFFSKNDVDIIGISPEDITFTIGKALSKIGYLDYGFTLDDANHIFTVIEPFEKVLKLRPDLLLLPYCSKDTGCDFRHRKECPACGECTVGDAYEIGREHALSPITIVSFEDLIRTLLRYKKKGKHAFVGCCCEPFYIKHEHDFERAGLPGILINIDNTTCYELGEENRAYAGMFEKKTDLRVDLLKKVVSMVSNGKG